MSKSPMLLVVPHRMIIERNQMMISRKLMKKIREINRIEEKISKLGDDKDKTLTEEQKKSLRLSPRLKNEKLSAKSTTKKESDTTATAQSEPITKSVSLQHLYQLASDEVQLAR